MKTKDELYKVVGIGETDFEFNLNLTETELVLYKINPESLNSVSDLIPLLKINELKEKLYISSNNNLLNIFLYLNKTNPQKTFVEYVSLNCIMVNPENFFMKEKMIKELEENCMFLIEANLLPPTKIKINLNIPNRPTKILEMEFTSNDYIYDKSREEKDRLEAEQYRKMELERSLQKTHASAKKNEAKKEPTIVKKETMNFNKKNDETSKKEDLQNKYKEITNEIKNELKKDENKKNEEKKQEVKKEESKVDDKNNDNNKEEKKSDAKKEETKDSSKNQEGKKDENKPKTGNHVADKISLNLPVPQRQQSLETPNVIYPEGKDETDQIPFRSDKTAILISSKSKSNIPSKNVNLLDLKYDFSNCNYIFIDLNFFINKLRDLSSIHEFLNTRLVQNFSNTGIITICPSEDLITDENCSKIINFIKISDIVLYEMKNVKKITSILGYKMENEEFERKFCELNELQLVKTNNRQNRISLFLDDFSKFTIINQNKESGLVTLVKEFKFEIGLKLEYFNSIYHNFISLKNAFLSGFFSRLIQNYNYETAFFVGNETFKKTLDIFFNNKGIPRDDPDYFIVFTKKPAVKKELRKDKYVNRVPKRLANNININVFNINDKKSDFVLDGPNLLKSRLKEYNPLFDENLSSYFSSPFILKHLNKMGFIDRTGSVADHKTIKNLGLKVNNKKFLMKKLESEQKKLIKYIQKGEQKSSSPDKSMNKSEEEPENVIYPRIQSNYSVKLPSLNPKTRQYSFENNKKEFFAGNKIAEINKLQEHSVTLNLKNINRNFGGKINKNNKLPLLTESMKVNDISFDNYNELSENLEGNNSLRDDMNQNNSKNLNKLTRQLVKYQIEADNPFPKEQSFVESDYKNYYNSSSNDYSYKSPVKSNFNYELNELSTMRSEKLKSEVLKDLSKYSYKEGSSSKKKKKERLNDLAERHKYTYLEGKDKDFSFIKMSGKEITSKEDINKSSMRTNERDYHDEVRRDVNFISNEKAEGGGIYVPKDIEQIKRMEMENEKIQKQKDAERDAALQIYLENKRKEELRRIEEAKKEEQRRIEEKRKKEEEELRKKEEEMRRYEEEKRKAEEDRKKAQEEERKRIEEEKKKKESKKEEKKAEEKKGEDKKTEEKKAEEKKGEEKKAEDKKTEEKKTEEKKTEEKKGEEKKTEEKKGEDKKTEEKKG
jgi:hypothetical protein